MVKCTKLKQNKTIIQSKGNANVYQGDHSPDQIKLPDFSNILVRIMSSFSYSHHVNYDQLITGVIDDGNFTCFDMLEMQLSSSQATAG